MIAYVTDSTSMLDRTLAAAWGVVVVPIQITVDGATFSDGVDLSVDDYYCRVAESEPAISTSQPSPGTFLKTYEALADAGFTEIHSVHVGSKISGTLNSARLAACESPIPVHLYDSTTSSFGVAIALRAVVDCLEAGGDHIAASEAMSARVSTLRSAFFMDHFELKARGIGTTEVPQAESGRQVIWTIQGSQLLPLGDVGTLQEAVDLMLEAVLGESGCVHVAVGIGDLRNQKFVDLVSDRLRANDRILSQSHYRVGPSVAAFLGPNSGGLFWYPESLAAKNF